MARGRKPNTATNEDVGVFKFVEYNPEIMQDGSKTPNILIDNYVGVSIDEDNYELVKVKQTTVTEENIKSVTNVYEDKFKIGDTYQEWITMGKYLSSYERAVEYYSEKKFKNEASKLKYCTDISVLNKIRSDTRDTIYNFAVQNTIPQVVSELSDAVKTVQSLKPDIAQIKLLKQEAINECTKVIDVMKEKYIEMAAKGLVKTKVTKHQVKEETE
jgi:hypothetical protein